MKHSIDRGFEARALGQPIYTEADSYEKHKENIKEAVSLHFDSAEMPGVIRLHYVKEEVIAA